MRMNGIELYEKLLGETVECSDLNMIVANYTTKEKKQKLGHFILQHKDKIYQLLVDAYSHEKQTLILKLVSKTLSKSQIITHNFFKSLTKKSTELPIQKFLLTLNFMFNRKITGCEYIKFAYPNKRIEFKHGCTFIEMNSIKFYNSTNVVVLYNTSILNMKITNTSIFIEAKDNKHVEIELPDTEQTSIYIAVLKKKFANKMPELITSKDEKAVGILQEMINEIKPNSGDEKENNEEKEEKEIVDITSSFTKRATFNEAENTVVNYTVPKEEVNTIVEKSQNETETNNTALNNLIRKAEPVKIVQQNKPENLIEKVKPEIKVVVKATKKKQKCSISFEESASSEAVHVQKPQKKKKMLLNLVKTKTRKCKSIM